MAQTQSKIISRFLSSERKIEFICPSIHFLLTFLLERVCFVFSDNWLYSNEIARNSNVISDSAELIITYILSKICAGIIIWLLWKLFFGIIKGRISKSIVILFGIIFGGGLCVGLVLYPDMLAISIDNYTNYTMAIRFLPTYWQSVFTGMVFAGCMMVIPHPFSLFIFQWLAFVSVVAYIYKQVEDWLPERNAKYITLLLFFLPETYYIVTDPYRNNYYTVLCLFYFSYIFFMDKKENKSFSTKEMIIICILSAFIMVWRTEGILIGAGGTLYLLLYVYKVKFKKILMLVLVILSSFLLLNSIQGLGAKKYYGQDYMIINTTDVLYHLLNHPQIDLAYEGAIDDLAAIDAVVPVRVLKEKGMDGYRDYNWTAGREDFNQTLATDEAAAAYMSAYYRIILHNMIFYFDVQLNCFFDALEVDLQHYTYSYSGDIYTPLESFDYYRWEIGRSELMATPMTSEWDGNSLRGSAYVAITWILNLWRELWILSGINAILHVLVLIADVLILFVECVKLIIERKKDNLRYIILLLILMGEFAAVFLFMPVGRPAYLYPMLYTSYFLIFVYYFEQKIAKNVRFH